MSSYPYSEVIQGKTVYSNYPFDSTPPPGALVQMDIKFNVPIASLVQAGYDLLTIFGQPTFQSELVSLGYNGTVTNYAVYTVDAYTQRIAFEMPPAAAGIVTPFLAPVIVAGIALAIIIIATAIAWSIGYVVAGVSAAIAAAAPWVIPIIGILAAVGVSAFLYDFLKDSGYRKDVYREVGHTAKGAVRGAAHVVGEAARGAEKGALSLARIRAKERVEKERTAKEAESERREAEREREERAAEREERAERAERRRGSDGVY